MPVYLLATLDTKGAEAAFVEARLRELGALTTVMDCGCASEAGDRGRAVNRAAERAAREVAAAFAAGQVDGVLGLGGSAGTTIGTAAMRALPLGVPKLMVSTLASGQVRPYVADKDICMLNSVVDIAGLNRISRRILAAAAAAMAKMWNGEISTAFGNVHGGPAAGGGDHVRCHDPLCAASSRSPRGRRL
jgi:uncharacterized protein (UPF0261 family)